MLAHPVDPAYFQGQVSLQQHADGIQPWRLPHWQRSLFHTPDDGLVLRASFPAGVRLRLRTAAASVGLRLVPLTGDGAFDLVRDNGLLATQRLGAGATEVVFGGLPAGDKVLEIWLPVGIPVIVRALLTEPGAAVAPEADPRRRWVTYGSSITHCGAAHSPARTWPATAARARDLHLTCLGYGGQCHLDALLGRVIRDLPADLITMKLGINTVGGSLSPRTFKIAVVGLVQLIRERHPATPIGLISPIISPPREDTPGATGMTLRFQRDEIADAAARLRAAGDAHLSDFSGLLLFGPELVGPRLPDQLHPDGDGYEIMGRNFIARVLAPMGF